MAPSSKPQSTPTRPGVTASSLIKAAAIAAGGRIVAPSTAASLFQAAQSKNAFHIRAGGSYLTPAANKGQRLCVPGQSWPLRPPPRRATTNPKKQGGTSFARKILSTGAQQSFSSPANTQETIGKQSSDSKGDRGLLSGVTEGGNQECGAVLNQDHKGSLEVNEKDIRLGKDVDMTVDNSKV